MKIFYCASICLLLISCNDREISAVVTDDAIIMNNSDGTIVTVTQDSVVMKTPYGESKVSTDSIFTKK